MKKRFIVANWKMKPETAEQARELLARTDDVLGELGEHREFSLVICPPFVFLDEVAAALELSHLRHASELGAQDIAFRDDVALTGEVSGPQLVNSGVRYVIVGHSERRYKLGEDDRTVNEKLKAALRNGLVPIVCVGEQTREDQWQERLKDQVRGTFQGLEPAALDRCLVAYEPVWAISTNRGAKPDTPESATVSIALVRQFMMQDLGATGSGIYLYGGSVNPENLSSFLGADGIDGVLIGGASVRPDDFASILRQTAVLL